MAQNLSPKLKMTKKIYDPRLVWPYSLLLCGPTGCGKTTWIVELLRHHEELMLTDDVMNEVSSNSMVSKLFTRGRSHLGCSLVLMLQNIFPKGTQSRTISINAQYQVLFRNPRDSLQISIFARQLYPHNSKDFLEIYKRATQRPYGYLFCCFTQSSRRNSLSHEHFPK